VDQKAMQSAGDGHSALTAITHLGIYRKDRNKILRKNNKIGFAAAYN
jgi:hypothetical protein